MTDHDEAVQIAISVPVYPQTTDEDHARAIVAALRARWEFVEPGKLAALWAVAEAGAHLRVAQDNTEGLNPAWRAFRAALDAAAAAGDASEAVRYCGNPIHEYAIHRRNAQCGPPEAEAMNGGAEEFAEDAG